jgi:hypothetical protein
MPRLELRPRSNAELIDASFSFVRANYVSLLGVVALAQLPFIVGSLFLPASPEEMMRLWTTHLSEVAVVYVFILWWWAVMACALVLVTADLIDGHAPRTGWALQRALRRGFAVGAAMLIQVVVFVLWAMLFLIPAIWAFARYFAVTPALAIENLGPLAAIRRSKELARGANGRVLVVAGLPFLAYLIFGNIIQQTFLTLGGYSVFARAVGSLMTALIYPFAAVPAILLYYDLRIRREGLDIQLDAALPTAAA